MGSSSSNRLNLIVGGDSMIGQALATTLALRGERVLASTRRRELISDQRPFIDLESHNWPDPRGFTENADVIVYLCAAVAKIAACEADPLRARAVNVTGCVGLSAAFQRAGARVVALSTNQVLSGEVPCEPSHAAYGHRTTYGRVKAEAEIALLALGDRVAVLRLAKVFGPDDLLLTGWKRDLKSGTPISPFFDMTASAVAVDRAVTALIALGHGDGHGLYQYSAAGDVTYADLAFGLAKVHSLSVDLVHPISWRTVRLGYTPPAFTSMDGARILKEFNLHQPHPLEVVEPSNAI